MVRGSVYARLAVQSCLEASATTRENKENKNKKALPRVRLVLCISPIPIPAIWPEMTAISQIISFRSDIGISVSHVCVMFKSRSRPHHTWSTSSALSGRIFFYTKVYVYHRKSQP